MATGYFNGFDVTVIDADGFASILAGETLTWDEISGAGGGTVVTDASGCIVGASLTGLTSATAIVEFSHATYPEVFRRQLAASIDDAGSLDENFKATYIAEDLYTETTEATMVDLWLRMVDDASVADQYLGRFEAGTEPHIPYETTTGSRNMRVYANPVTANSERRYGDHRDGDSADVVIDSIPVGEAAFGPVAANTLFAGPTTGANAEPTFRALVTNDLPNNVVTLAKLATQAANTILANASASTAVPTAVALAANQFLARSSSGNIAAKAITDAGLALLDDADAAAMRSTLGLVIGTNVQAYDAELAAIAGLTSAADKGIYFTGAGTAGTFDLTSFARTVLDDANQAAMQTTLGLGTADSPQFTAINLGHASDTTLTRTAAGDIAIEGNAVYRAGGTDVPAADGGTGRSSHTAYAVLCGGTTSTAAQQSVAALGTAGQVLTSNGAGALPTFQDASGGLSGSISTTYIPMGTGAEPELEDSPLSYASDIFSFSDKTIESATWHGEVIDIIRGGSGQSTATEAFKALSPITQRYDMITGNIVGTPGQFPANVTTTPQFLYSIGNGTSTTTFGWRQIDVSTDVTGDLPFSRLAQGSALSVLGVTGNATADVASIAAGSDHQVLRRSGTALTFGAVNLASSNAVTGVLPIANGGTNASSFGTSNGVVYFNGTSLVNHSRMTFNGSVLQFAPSGSTPVEINWGSAYGGRALTLYDGGATERWGWALQASEMQFFGPSSGTNHVSWNKGGDLQASGTNEVMRLVLPTGMLKLGGTATRGTTEGTNQLVLFNGTAPVGTLTNGASFYAASGEMRVMDASGNSTLLSPHDRETNEWIYYSKHTPTGRVLRINLEGLLKAVNEHLSTEFIEEYYERPMTAHHSI